MGSYFGSELCPVDINMDGITDFLLVAAPFYHIHGQEGRVYVYRLNKQVGESPSLQACWGCGYLAWCGDDGGWKCPGSALHQRAVMGRYSGWMAARWGISHFLTFPTPSSHIDSDDIPNNCMVDKTCFVYDLTCFFSNYGT